MSSAHRRRPLPSDNQAKRELMPTLKEQFWDPVAGFGVTFRTMFRKVVTEQYPFEKKPTAPRFHGRHQLNRWPDGLEKCIGCELCAWACPADAIYVEGASNTDADERYSPGERYGRVYQINYLRCILCGLCIEACPTRALTMTNEYELADDNRADLIYEKSDLLAPLLPGMEQPPHAMQLGDDEGDYYRGDVLAAPATASRRDERGLSRRDRLLDPRADHGARRARHPVRPQGRARRAAAGGGDDQPGGALRRAGRAVPVRGADHRLHRRDPDAVPVRADAGRRRRLRLGGRDDPGPAADGRRSSACCFGVAAGRSASARSPSARSTGLDAANRGGNVQGLAQLLFTKYVFAFEATSALLITAAIGAMVLAHRERLGPKPTQADLAAQRMRDYAEHGRHLGPLPAPGVFARHNAVDTPALLPDGTPSEARCRGCSPARGHRSAATGRRRRRRRAALAGARRPSPTTPTARRHERGGRRMSATPFLVLSAILFTIGCVGVLTRRNAIVVFMCVELMLNASNLALVTFARVQRQPRRPGRRLLRDGGRRRRGRRRAGDHHDHLPHPPLGLGRRREPAEVLRSNNVRSRCRSPRPWWTRPPRAACSPCSG